MSRPSVVILCPREFKFTDHEASVERPVLGDVAELTTVWLDFNAPFPAEVLGADAIILWHGPRVTAEVVAGMTRCRAIVRNGVGFDSVDLAAAARAGIPVCNVPDYGTEEVADHAIALTLALYRQLFPLDAEAKRLGWKTPAQGSSTARLCSIAGTVLRSRGSLPAGLSAATLVTVTTTWE